MDITPAMSQGSQLINRYGSGGFIIAGVEYTSPVLVLQQQTAALAISAVSELTPAMLQPVIDAKVEILLVGCGASITPFPKQVRDVLRTHGVVVELMDTGAACRTFNVLLAEERQIGAVLLPV